MKRITLIVLACLLFASQFRAFAAEEIEVTPPDREISLPYAFYDEIFGAAVAYVYSINGYPQPQSALLATAMVGSKGSAMLFVMGRDIRVFGVKRLFLDPIAQGGYFANNKAYINGNPAFAGQRAGSNDSDKKNYIIGNGQDNFFRMNFKYLLPIGNGKNQIADAYRVEGGLLESGASGGTSWNPLKSGRTFLEVQPFYRSMKIRSDVVTAKQNTNGFDFSLFWENRDFILNPSQGNSVQLKVSRDFGWGNSSNPWTVYAGEIDKYFSLGPSDTFRQRVIALDFWTAYSPSWEVQPNGNITDRPPSYAGATLGGLWRLRGYPDQRFSDKAGIYCGAEYRMIPEWNPFNNWPWLQQYLGIQWVQFVPFIEVGRVAPSWNPHELNSAMKSDAGLGFLFMAKGLVGRIDVAASREGGSVQMMVNQPFQF